MESIWSLMSTGNQIFDLRLGDGGGGDEGTLPEGISLAQLARYLTVNPNQGTGRILNLRGL